MSVATTLKDLMSPYLLRRSKAEVQDHILLPNKSEQVLFCSLSDEQKDLYKGYLLVIFITRAIYFMSISTHQTIESSSF